MKITLENHFNHCTFERLNDLKGCTGIEIFNRGCVSEPGSDYALDKWDRVLAAGRPFGAMPTTTATLQRMTTLEGVLKVGNARCAVRRKQMAFPTFKTAS